jgi:hypothetical protein
MDHEGFHGFYGAGDVGADLGVSVWRRCLRCMGRVTNSRYLSIQLPQWVWTWACMVESDGMLVAKVNGR